MRQFSDGSLTSRAELLVALDKLCEAMKHLARTAENKRVPRFAGGYESEAVETEQHKTVCCKFEEPCLELIEPAGGCTFSLAQEPPDTLPVQLNHEGQEPLFAGRLAELQERLGGFLK